MHQHDVIICLQSVVQAEQTCGHSRHQVAVEYQAYTERDLPTSATDFRVIVVVSDN